MINALRLLLVHSPGKFVRWRKNDCVRRRSLGSRRRRSCSVLPPRVVKEGKIFNQDFIGPEKTLSSLLSGIKPKKVDIPNDAKEGKRGKRLNFGLFFSAHTNFCRSLFSISIVCAPKELIYAKTFLSSVSFESERAPFSGSRPPFFQPASFQSMYI